VTVSWPDFASYWSGVEREVAALPERTAAVEEMPLRSTDGSDGYGVNLAGTGGHRVFAWYSVPRGKGPFPAIFQAPGYGSVVHVPPYERRQKYVVLALCHRGQRRSDSKYAAKYPGLLTDGVENPEKYVWRGIVADCLAAIDFLLSRPEVDRARVAATGNDLAYIAAGLRPQIGSVLVTGELLFRDTVARLTGVRDYPLEEFNDYLRSHPGNRAAVRATLGLFDPLGFSGRVRARTLVSCASGARAYSGPLATASSRNGQVRINTGRGFVDHGAEERWLDSALAAG
jgi:cephalosporin-C deacetylase